jgi:ribonuclease R
MKKGLPTRPTGDRPKPRDAEREGTLTVNPRGFGFVASEGAAGDDVYVAREAMAGAMHGDRVRVQVTGRTTQGSEGVVVAVLDRSVVRVAGVLRRRGASAWIEPDDTGAHRPHR